jgi:hypothetical protein
MALPRKLASFALMAPAPVDSGRRTQRSHQGQKKRKHGDPDTLTCHNCQEEYSISEARVQRSLKQFFAQVAPKPSSVTPRLCWVCSHLYYAAYQMEGLDRLWDGFSEEVKLQ